MFRFKLVLFAVASFALWSAWGVCYGQNPERKVVERVAHVYPEIARRSHLGGVVNVVALVARDGKVKSAKPVGGSPVFIQAALEAVRQWHFETAAADSTENVQIVFDPSH